MDQLSFIKSRFIRKVRYVHVRSYLPMFLMLVFNRSLGYHLTFDMRAVWTEELRQGVRLGSRWPIRTIINYLEYWSLSNSKFVISLTHKAVGFLEQKHSLKLRDKTLVIPTVSEVSPFQSHLIDENILNICVLGSIGSKFFDIDLLNSVIKTIALSTNKVNIDFITTSEFSTVKGKLDSLGLCNVSYEVFSLEHNQVRSYLPKYAGSLFFFKDLAGKIGSFPTRFAELAVAGVPILSNGNIGDMSWYLKRYPLCSDLNEGSSHEKKQEIIKQWIAGLNSSAKRFELHQIATDELGINSARSKYIEMYAT